MEPIGDYRLIEWIGEGGLGEVYRAQDTRTGRTVAMKLLPASIARDPGRRAQFIADARKAAAISHPNAALVFDIMTSDDGVALAVEFVPGQSLRLAMGGRPLHQRRAVEIAIQMADALADAHALGLRHLHLSPDTIMITPKGSSKLLDLGLSAWTAGGRARAAAAARIARGEPIESAIASSLPPEQALGGAIDERSDLFSLGAVLYEMLTGRPPFAVASPDAPPPAVIQSMPPPPSRANRQVPPELDAIVAKALARDPDARYRSAAQMAIALRDIAGILTTGPAEHPRIAVVPGARRALWTATLGALTLFAIVLWLWLGTGR